MEGREKNYVSAVVYLGNEQGCAGPFTEMLTRQLGGRFENYELVFVEDASRDGTLEEVRDALAKLEAAPPVTIIHMSLHQGVELAMNAGLDAAIGDFVFAFDSMKTPYPEALLLEAYEACLAGSDIVVVSPARNRGITSALFYRLFNSSSASPHRLQTSVFSLLSRRAVNRLHAITPTMPYRKAAYATSGLKMQTLEFSGSAGRVGDKLRLGRAMDSLLLYTGIGYRISVVVSGLMLLLSVGEVAYILVVLLSGLKPVEGWTTTMLVMTVGFFGVFLILTIVLKYLSLLLDLLFRKQKYLVESIEKLQ